MSFVEEFIKAPSVEFLEQCTRDQLVKLAEHLKIELTDKRLKENISVDLNRKMAKGNLVY